MGVIPAGTKQKGSIGAIDAGGEKASVSFWLPVITAANEAAQSAAWTAVLDAWDDLFLGNRYVDSYVDRTTYPVGRPTNGAMRELSLKLIARSAATGETVNYYCPTIDQSLISFIPNYGAKDVVDMTTAELAAFISALNAMPLKNPYDVAYTDNMVIVGAQVVKGMK